MKREVDDRGNIVIHGLPQYDGEEVWNGGGAYGRTLGFLRSVLEQARLFGPIIFASAVFIVLVTFGTLAVFAFLDTGDPSLEEEVAALATAASNPERTGSGSGGYGSADEERSAVAVDVLSEPAGAAVLVDFDSIGTTPLHQYRIPEGVYILSVAFDEEDRRDSVIVLEDAASTTFSFSRERMPDGAEDTSEVLASMPAEASSSTLSRSSASSTEARTPSRDEQAAARGEQEATRGAGLPTATARTPATDTQARAAEIASSADDRANELPEPELLAGVAQSSSVDQSRTAEGTGSDASESDEASDEPSSGRLVVLVKPWGSIYVNDALHARNLDIRYTAALEPGTYRIGAEHPVLGRREVDIQIGPDETREITINLLGEDSP